MRIGAGRTNPFTLTLEVEDLALDDVDGQEIIGFERLFVDVGCSSPFEWTAIMRVFFRQEAIQRQRASLTNELRRVRLLWGFCGDQLGIVLHRGYFQSNGRPVSG